MNPTRRHFLAQASALAHDRRSPGRPARSIGHAAAAACRRPESGLRALLEAAGELNGGVRHRVDRVPGRRAARRSAERGRRRLRPDRRRAGDLRARVGRTHQGDRREPLRPVRHGGARAARCDAERRGRPEGQAHRHHARLDRPFRHAEGVDAAGLPPDAVSFRFLPPADTMLALATGSIDAWATWGYTALAETSGRARARQWPRTVVGPQLPRGDRRGDRGEARRAAISCGASSARRPGRTAMSMRIPPHSRASSAFRRRPKLQFERRNTRWLPIDATVIAEQQRTADFYLKAGLLRQPLDVRTTFDSGFPLA